MILRKKKLNIKNETIEVAVSFSEVDVKEWLFLFAWLFHKGLKEGQEFVKTMPVTEMDIRYWLEHEPHALKTWPDKWREQISAWAWATMLRKKYLVPSATKENTYFLADYFINRTRKPHVI